MLADGLFWSYTGLCGEDLDYIMSVARNMDVMAELTGADIFIDCLEAQSGSVFVAAHAAPAQGGSLYETTVVGQRVLPENEAAVYTAFESGMPMRDIKAITQENNLVSQDVVPLFGAGGSVIAVIIRETDITLSMERIKKIELLENTISRLKNTLEDFRKEREDIVNYINKGVVIFDANGVAIYFNGEAARIYKALGFSEPLVGMTFDEASFGSGDLVEIRAGSGREATVRAGDFSLLMRGQRLGEPDTGGIFALFIDDLTELKKKEDEIISHSQAIKEINHRIKNSLQMVASMLSIQSRRAESPSAREFLQSAISRVYNISMVYDLLAKQSYPQDVWLRELLVGVTQCAESYVLSDQLDLRVSVEGDDFRVSGDSATTIGIVVHELVVNALRHAFSGREAGNIRVHLQKGNRYSSIVVEDDGTGCDSGGREGFGIGLTRTMVREKLNGRLNIQSAATGTKVMFDFENTTPATAFEME